MRQLREKRTLLAFRFFALIMNTLFRMTEPGPPSPPSPLSHQKQLEAVTRERDNLRMVAKLPFVALQLLAPGLSKLTSERGAGRTKNSNALRILNKTITRSQGGNF